jgi:hypothetical protein
VDPISLLDFWAKSLWRPTSLRYGDGDMLIFIFWYYSRISLLNCEVLMRIMIITDLKHVVMNGIVCQWGGVECYKKWCPNMYLNLLLVDYIGASLSNNSLIWDTNLTHTLATLYLMGLYGEEEWRWSVNWQP